MQDAHAVPTLTIAYHLLFHGIARLFLPFYPLFPRHLLYQYSRPVVFPFSQNLRKPPQENSGSFFLILKKDCKIGGASIKGVKFSNLEFFVSCVRSAPRGGFAADIGRRKSGEHEEWILASPSAHTHCLWALIACATCTQWRRSSWPCRPW